MPRIFLEILNMSISASYLIIAVVLLRLALKKAPKWVSVLLFGIVAIRLICPISIESVLSLIPSAETVSPDIMTDANPQINSGIPVINDAINPIISDKLSPSPDNSVNPMQIAVFIASLVWLTGVTGLIVYASVGYLKIKRRVATAVLWRDNVYKSENIASPFVLGIIRPKIYLPFSIRPEHEGYVIAHEEAHLSRMDHLWKPLGFILLALHWFNPLVWVAYVLLSRDIESACDERVIKELGVSERADYSEALLSCSVEKRLISACPLAFGEQGVKGRIRSVLSYRKPAFWLIVVALIITAFISLLFLTNPVRDDGYVLDDKNLLYAWKGEFYANEATLATYKYSAFCENLVWSEEKGIYIKPGFSIENAEVHILSPGVLEDYYSDTPYKYFIAPEADGSDRVLIDIGWFFRAEEEYVDSTVWSYLVTLTDKNGEQHHYYFRVDYGNQNEKAPTASLEGSLV